jgi:hypothetical protein
MEIYRVPGSVSFLRSGTLLHAILPRSNCWCVDGVSKFALRVLPDTYYRIELPGESDEDLQAVEKCKETLRKVLFFERTPCPFSRTFTVDLPEEPEVRKKRRKSSGPAKKWRLDHGYSWKPEGWVPPEEGGEESASGSSVASDEEDGSDSGNRSEASELADEVKELKLSTPPRPRVTPGLRSVTVPSPTVLQSPPPSSNLRTSVSADGTVEVSESVTSESSSQTETPSSRTLQAIPTSMPPSPPESSAGTDYTEHHAQSQGGAVDDRAREDDVEAVSDRSVNEPRTAEHGVDQTVDTKSTSELVSKAAGSPITRLESDRDIPERDVPEQGALHQEIPEQDTPEQDIPEQDIPEQDISEQDISEQDIAEHDVSEQAITEDEPASSAYVESFSEHELDATTSVSTQQHDDDDDDDGPRTPEAQTASEDPYAAIQARILARRSIGGTTSFYPGHKSPTRESTSSTSSTTTVASNKSTLSRRSQSSQRQHAFATSMVKKACAVFLGPPARLVAIMLQIAARYADAAFGVNSMFYVESPIDSPRKVPGSYHLEGDDLHELDMEWEEDDFGVPLRSPVRLASFGGTEGVRERRGWDVD